VGEFRAKVKKRSLGAAECRTGKHSTIFSFHSHFYFFFFLPFLMFWQYANYILLGIAPFAIQGRLSSRLVTGKRFG
jgi:hypothetical protein